MLSSMIVSLLLAAVLGQTAARPLAILESEPPAPARRAARPAGALLARLGAEPRAPAERPDARLGLPSPQELEAIRKVAQILVTLGEQVIPTIISGLAPPPAPPPPPAPAPGGAGAAPAEDAPHDPVNY